MAEKSIKRIIASIAISLIGLSSSLPSYRALAAEVNPKLGVAKPNPQFQTYLDNKSSINVNNGLIPSPISITKSNAVIKKDTAMPSKYDLRLFDRLTAVKDQGGIGSCWSFAAYSAMESNMLSSGLGSYDFSENNLITHHGFDYGPNDGGNVYMSTAYFTRWAGPVFESKDPYPAVAKPENIVYRNGLAADKHVQEVLYIPARNGYSDNGDIKSAVMKYGAVDSSLRYDDIFYNRNNFAYYTNEPINPYNSYTFPNHEITIVGWDDSYPSSNFNTTPPGNGAFIARNNWGSAWGDKGYFYISYYDEVIGNENAVFPKVESNNNYKKVYQYDDLGMIANVGYDSSTAWFANVFNYASYGTKKESVQAVGFYTTKKNASYEVYYQYDFDGQRFSNMKKVAAGVVDMPGYHTIKLDAPQSMVLGKKFAVAVKLYVPGEPYPIGMEYADSGYSGKAVSDYNQSFVSDDGIYWDDAKPLGNDIGLSNANVCLKAYTDVSYDLNCDSRMDILDLATLSKSYNTTKVDNVTFDIDADVNDDGIVDLLDLILLSSKL